MAHESENTENFDRLIQLLAVKRYEQPDAGYFEQFPREVRLRIMAASNPRQRWDGQTHPEFNWFRHLLRLMEGRPVIAGTLAAFACFLMIGGLVYSSYYAPTPAPEVAIETLAPSLAPALAAAHPDSWAPAAPASESSTNPILNHPVPAMFFKGGALSSQPVTLEYTR